jgi:hypothetical protein
MMVASALFVDNVLVWIAVELMSKKDCVHIHWIRHKTQRWHVMEPLTISASF